MPAIPVAKPSLFVVVFILRKGSVYYISGCPFGNNSWKMSVGENNFCMQVQIVRAVFVIHALIPFIFIIYYI